MKCVRSALYVHLDDASPMMPGLNLDKQAGYIDLGEWPSKISLFMTAEQARKLSQVAGQLADMIEDANLPGPDPTTEDEEVCDLGGQPIPYVQPS